jgi:hypothetical protein
MAQYTLNASHYMRPYRSQKAAPQIRHFACSTAVSTARVTVGMPVTFDTLVGTACFRIVRPKIASSNSQMEIAITSLAGIAAETDATAVSTAAGTTIPVYIADGQAEWLGYCYGAGVVASTMIGQQKLVVWDSTLKTFFIDSTNSTVAMAAVTITDIPEYALNSTNGPVIFKFLSSLVSAIVK